MSLLKDIKKLKRELGIADKITKELLIKRLELVDDIDEETKKKYIWLVERGRLREANQLFKIVP